MLAMFRDRMKVVWYLWLATLLMVVGYVISSLAAATDTTNTAFGFAAVWLAIIMVGFAVSGTIILRYGHYKEPLLLGVFIGLAFMSCMFMLTMAVLSGSSLTTVGDSTVTSKPSHVSTVFFAVMLFLGYGVLTACLVLFRNDLMAAQPMADQDAAMPPAPGGEYGGGGGGGDEYASGGIDDGYTGQSAAAAAGGDAEPHGGVL